MKAYAIEIDGKIQVVKAVGFVPDGGVEIPDSIPEEDYDYVVAADGAFTVDAGLKTAGDAAKLAAKAEADKHAKYMKRFRFARIIKADIAVLNDTKAWNSTQIQTYLADPDVKQINSLISEISLSTAKTLLESTDLSAYYTTEEKQAIIDKIGAYLLSEG